ncbi:hypothetical protein PULV_b0065 [Pseudoalteromonas ulvae UL12]|uniref:alpha-E domain-containing protein n=1 Tax=Pseudoalteromonas ulvae TaxID=107327 RepID=UPI0019F9F9D0|nr:alpha-E domain-containing protein [Pseudoalteromonas ulvae]MBE0365486.1 hypothetical protein [Pseudoalteromonas ulvae UL12]
MSMLSRVASNIYWLGRYLERAENTARIINVNTNLLLDLPKYIKLGWQPLLEITSTSDSFKAMYTEVNELNVSYFLMAEPNNPSSILSSLMAARENARTIREIIPREVWEQINSLYLVAKEQLSQPKNNRHRYDNLNKIIQSNQAITGTLAGSMTHDEGYDFLRMGRNIERADMTTRIIDVRTATLLPNVDQDIAPFETIQWMSVLKSLTGYQMYRRQMRLRINRKDVLSFLLLDEKFPRALKHTLKQVEYCLSDLPNSEQITHELSQLYEELAHAQLKTLKQESLHEFIDDLQLGIHSVHDALSRQYF